MNSEFDVMMKARFSKDSLIALATADGNMPHVRAVNAYYMDGSFYCVTYAASNKMKQIERNNAVALCGEWFSGHGRASSLGHVLCEENREKMNILRPAFASWYSLGHVDEHDENTILLRIELTDGVLFVQGRRYEY